MQERDLDELPLAVESDDIAVHVVDGHDALLLTHLIDRAKLVPVDGGELEVHLARGLPHLGVEVPGELVVTALEELCHRVDLLGVPPLVHREHAGTRTSLDLVLQARALASRELHVAARP